MAAGSAGLQPKAGVEMETSLTAYSHSEMSCYRDCPLKYQLKYQVGLVSLAAQDHALHFGHAFHCGLEARRAMLVDNPTATLADVVKVAQEAFTRDYDPSLYPLQLNRYDVGKTYRNGLDALAGYAETYAEEDQQWEVLSNEAAQEFVDGGGVHLDYVVKYQDGRIYGVDTKTTGKYLDGDYWDKLQINSQMRHYTRFIQERYGECSGFIIDAVSLKYRSKVYHRGDDYRDPGYWHSFCRMTYNIDDHVVALEAANTDYWSQRIRESVATERYGYNTDSCYRCEYRDICKRGWTVDQDMELILDGGYRLVCGQQTESRRICQLNRGHDGDGHSDWLPPDLVVAPEADFEVIED